MNDLRKAAQALVNQWESNTAYPFGLLVDALRAALAQPEQDLQLVANFLKEYGLEVLEVIAALKAQPEQEAVMVNGLTEVETNATASVMGLTQPRPEPELVAWMQTENFIDSAGLWDERKTFNFEGDGTPLYTAPPQRNPLTEEEIAALSEQHIFASRMTKFVRAIEKAHGIGGQP